MAIHTDAQEPLDGSDISRMRDAGLFTGDTESGLEKLRMKLLDLTKRNRLLNFTHRKGSLRLIDEMPNFIFEELLGDAPLLLRPVPEPNAEELPEEERDKMENLHAAEKLKYVATEIEGLNIDFDLPHQSKDDHPRHQDPELQTLHFPEALEAVASTIYRAANLAIEETGSNMCFLAFGFLEWDEDRDITKRYLAPLMLMPVTLTKGVVDQASGMYRYAVTYSGEDMMPNLSLIEYLKCNANIAFPDVEEGELPELYWERCAEVVRTKPRWKIKRFVTLALFQFQKLLMYLDLDPDRWPEDNSIIFHEKIREFFEGSGELMGDSAIDYPIDEMPHRTSDIFLIDDADSSQTSAIIDAIEGKDLVIQGPPGTGKSQTITNLIACALAKGKSVLFVAEKLAALQVVKNRLDAAGLGDFCLELHSNKVNKLTLLRSLKERLDYTLQPLLVSDSCHELEERRNILHELVRVLSSKEPRTGLIVQELLVKATSLRLQAQRVLTANDFEKMCAGSFPVEEHGRLRGAILDLISAYKGLGEPAVSHPWAAIGNSEITTSRSEILRNLDSLAEGAAELESTTIGLGEKLSGKIPGTFEAMGRAAGSASIFDGSIELNASLVSGIAEHLEATREFISSIKRVKKMKAQIATKIPCDGKQLPPTSFFSRFGFKDEGDSEDNTVIDESESILEAASALYQPSRQLKWHYRSQHESLIAFSNYRFYNGSLVVFPSPHGESPDYGVKFRRVDGQYGGSKNEIEAIEVAKAVIEHVRFHPDESVGVVAMNIQQASLIQDCLDKLLKEDPLAQVAYTDFHERNEEVFVKNLENVQGDERDVIIISVTYGPNEHGVITRHFGPIVSATGWRRLNVLFTRARKRVHVISSMSGDQIGLEADSSLGLRAFKEYLSFAENGCLPTAIETSRPAGSPFEEEVESHLLEKGFECRKQLGVASYFLDLAVRHPDKPGRYLLGIECDGVSYHSSKCARDRDRLRQEILERMGWRIHRIWSTDWFRDPHHEIRMLVERLQGLARKGLDGDDPFVVQKESKASNYDEDMRIIRSHPPAEWAAAARWAKNNNTLSGFQRRTLYLTGTKLSEREEFDEKTAREAAEAMSRVQRMGFSTE